MRPLNQLETLLLKMMSVAVFDDNKLSLRENDDRYQAEKISIDVVYSDGAVAGCKLSMDDFLLIDQEIYEYVMTSEDPHPYVLRSILMYHLTDDRAYPKVHLEMYGKILEHAERIEVEHFKYGPWKAFIDQTSMSHMNHPGNIRMVDIYPIESIKFLLNQSLCVVDEELRGRYLSDIFKCYCLVSDLFEITLLKMGLGSWYRQVEKDMKAHAEKHSIQQHTQRSEVKSKQPIIQALMIPVEFLDTDLMAGLEHDEFLKWHSEAGEVMKNLDHYVDPYIECISINQFCEMIFKSKTRMDKDFIRQEIQRFLRDVDFDSLLNAIFNNLMIYDQSYTGYVHGKSMFYTLMILQEYNHIEQDDVFCRLKDYVCDFTRSQYEKNPEDKSALSAMHYMARLISDSLGKQYMFMVSSESMHGSPWICHFAQECQKYIELGDKKLEYNVKLFEMAEENYRICFEEKYGSDEMLHNHSFNVL